MDNKRYNVWAIRNLDGKFYHKKYKMSGRTPSGKPKMVFDGIEWVDNFSLASFYNYKGAESEITAYNLDGVSIIGSEEYKNSL